MGSVIDMTTCPVCGDKNAQYESYYKTGEESIFCSICGHYHRFYIRRDKEGNILHKTESIDPSKIVIRRDIASEEWKTPEKGIDLSEIPTLRFAVQDEGSIKKFPSYARLSADGTTVTYPDWVEEEGGGYGTAHETFKTKEGRTVIRNVCLPPSCDLDAYVKEVKNYSPPVESLTVTTKENGKWITKAFIGSVTDG